MPLATHYRCSTAPVPSRWRIPVCGPERGIVNLTHGRHARRRKHHVKRDVAYLRVARVRIREDGIGEWKCQRLLGDRRIGGVEEPIVGGRAVTFLAMLSNTRRIGAAVFSGKRAFPSSTTLRNLVAICASLDSFCSAGGAVGYRTMTAASISFGDNSDKPAHPIHFRASLMAASCSSSLNLSNGRKCRSLVNKPTTLSSTEDRRCNSRPSLARRSEVERP